MGYYNTIFFRAYKKSIKKRAKDKYVKRVMIPYVIFAIFLMTFIFTMNYFYLTISLLSLTISVIVFITFIKKNIKNKDEILEETLNNQEKEIIKFKDELDLQGINQIQIDEMIEIIKYNIEIEEAKKSKINNISTTIIILSGLTFLLQLFLEFLNLRSSKNEKLIDIFIEFNKDFKIQENKINEVYTYLNTELFLYTIIAFFIILLSYFIFKSVAMSIISSNPLLSYNEKLLEKLNGVTLLDKKINAPS